MNKNLVNKVLVVVSILSILVLSGCGGGGNGGENGEASGDNQNAENNGNGPGGEGPGGEGQRPKAPQGVPVKVAQVTRGPITDAILSTSVVEAEQIVDVYARVTGTVTNISAEEGERVRAGNLLCALEDEELALGESKSKAEMEKLKTDLERTQTLLERGIATETDLANAKYAYEQAEINWRQAKTNLDYTQIKSTINAVVSERLVKLGQKVTPADKLYEMFDPGSLVINVFVPESDYFAKVAGRTGEVRAIISSDSLPGQEFYGSIKRVAPIVDADTNTIKITMQYRDPNNTLRPGMYVRVRLVTDTRENAVLVPKAALLFDENRQYVFVVRDGEALRITLDPGYEDTQYIEALSEIEEGDSVVTVGQNGLKTGTKVRIVDDSAPNPEPAPAESEEPQENEEAGQ